MTDAPRLSLRRVRLADLAVSERLALAERASTATPDIRTRARAIVESVRDGGDAALRAANARYGGGLLEPVGEPALRVPPERLREARDQLPRELRDGLEQMAAQHRALPRRRGAAAEQWVRWRRASRSAASGAVSTAWPPTCPAARRPTRRRCS